MLQKAISITDKKGVNPCYKCGTERIFQKTWNEEVITFTGKKEKITFLQTVCPNQICQALVDKEMKVEEEKREVLRTKKKANEDARKENFLSKEKKAKLKLLE